MKITDLGKVEMKKMDMEGPTRSSNRFPSRKATDPAYVLAGIYLRARRPYAVPLHPFEHLNYILEGSGVLVTETGEERPVKKGDFALVLPNEKHQYRNTSRTIPWS
jgi:uncharacterized cupin superfamily protein